MKRAELFADLSHEHSDQHDRRIVWQPYAFASFLNAMMACTVLPDLIVWLAFSSTAGSDGGSTALLLAALGIVMIGANLPIPIGLSKIDIGFQFIIVSEEGIGRVGTKDGAFRSVMFLPWNQVSGATIIHRYDAGYDVLRIQGDEDHVKLLRLASAHQRSPGTCW